VSAVAISGRCNDANNDNGGGEGDLVYKCIWECDRVCDDSKNSGVDVVCLYEGDKGVLDDRIIPGLGVGDCDGEGGVRGGER